MVRWMTFQSLSISEIRHAFSLRASVPCSDLEAALFSSIKELGIPPQSLAKAEQIHGNVVAAINAPTTSPAAGADALITATPGVTLVIRVADCGPVYVFDPVCRAIGLAHSGRKGTEGNITANMIAALQSTYGSNPKDMILQLGPCIRPPHYEINFAETIIQQAREAGVSQIHDCKVCTASNLEDFYSYRAEKGATGRHWALLQLIL